MRCALITGMNGQDGAYAAEQLRAEGYRVVAARRPGTSGPPGTEAVDFDLRDEASVVTAIERVRPHEIYNFAAYTSGADMFVDPVAIGDINGLAVARILSSIQRVDTSIRFCQASSSELFGDATLSPQAEDTPFRPRSPYGAAKLYAHEMIRIYRVRYGLFACSAILFNHESPRRDLRFVTRKVTRAAARISLGLEHSLDIGNLDARRDWGYAADHVTAMRLMLRAPTASDYVIATGVAHSVRELSERAFRAVGLDYRDHVREDPSAYRSDETVLLVGDASKARRLLGWSPSIDFNRLIRMMVDADLALARAENEAKAESDGKGD